MQIAGFHHVAVQVRDVELVSRFYVERLGLREVKRFHRDDGSLRSVWVALTHDDPASPFIAIEHDANASGRRDVGYSMLALRIAPERRAEIAASLGATVEKQTGWTLYVRDPEGNLIGLSHHPHDDPGATRGAIG